MKKKSNGRTMLRMLNTVGLFVVLFVNAFAQNSGIKNLVFEGAGMRGIAYVGVVQALEEKNLIETVEEVGGTSAGAITALLISLGYTSEEIGEIIAQTKFQRFNDGRFFFLGGLHRMKNRFGWYRGKAFSKWLAYLIEQKTGNPDITFKELHEKGFKELCVAATCLNHQELVFISRENYPQMKVKDAVRISMSIPLYFQAVFVDGKGNTFSKQNNEGTLDIMVDGGIVGNYPIDMFDSIASKEDGTAYRIPNPQTVGVRMDSDRQIQQDGIERKLAPKEIENFTDYISAFYVMVIENLNRCDLTDEDWNRTISVSSAGLAPKVKRFTKPEKDVLIRNGRESTISYLKNKGIY